MTDKNIAKKEKAIELLKQMDIYTPYIKGFREKGFQNHSSFNLQFLIKPLFYRLICMVNKKFFL